METNELFADIALPNEQCDQLLAQASQIARAAVYGALNPDKAEVWYSEARVASQRVQAMIEVMPDADAVRQIYRRYIGQQRAHYEALKP